MTNAETAKASLGMGPDWFYFERALDASIWKAAALHEYSVASEEARRATGKKREAAEHREACALYATTPAGLDLHEAWKDFVRDEETNRLLASVDTPRASTDPSCVTNQE